jgi:hypothetical protein
VHLQIVDDQDDLLPGILDQPLQESDPWSACQGLSLMIASRKTSTRPS